MQNVEEHQVREVLKCIIHTIIFNRALGHVSPRDMDLQLINISYVEVADDDIERQVEEGLRNVEAFLKSVRPRPSSASSSKVCTLVAERLLFRCFELACDAAYRGVRTATVTFASRETANSMLLLLRCLPLMEWIVYAIAIPWALLPLTPSASELLPAIQHCNQRVTLIYDTWPVGGGTFRVSISPCSAQPSLTFCLCRGPRRGSRSRSGFLSMSS